MAQNNIVSISEACISLENRTLQNITEHRKTAQNNTEHDITTQDNTTQASLMLTMEKETKQWLKR